MAIFDVQQQRIFARIVYDGAEQAGKTTNLRQLCSFFSLRRRSELVSPEELGGRTLYFDWLQISTGIVCGFPLVCQVITVPGQVVLEARRKALLASADALVFVVDSAAPLAPTRRALATLQSELGRRPRSLPFLLQANKQDAAGASSESALAGDLGLGADVPVLSAAAEQGHGVLETFVAAVRAVANDLTDRARRDGFRVAVDLSETSDELFDLLREVVVPAHWRSEIVKPELRRTEEPAREEPAREEPAREEPAREEPAAEEPAAEEPAAEEPEPAAAGPAEEPELQPAQSEQPATAAGDPKDERDRETTPPARPPRPSALAAVEELGAMLPSPEVPSGFIWPTARGRDVLRSLVYEHAIARPDLVGRRGSEDGSGRSDVLVCQAGDHCLKTSGRRCYPDAEAGRAALLSAVRDKVALGSLALPGTVLVLQADGRGRHWLWTVSPWATTMRGRMVNAMAADDVGALSEELVAYGRAAVAALRLAATLGMAIDVNPSNFGWWDGALYYLDDDVARGDLPALGHALLHRVDEHERYPEAIERYVQALETELAGLRAQELDRIDLAAILRDTLPRGRLSLEVRPRLLRALGSHSTSRPP